MGKRKKRQKPIVGAVELTRQMGRIPTAPPSKAFRDKSKYRRNEKHKKSWTPSRAGWHPEFLLYLAQTSLFMPAHLF